MAVYNTRNYVESAVQSVLQQTYCDFDLVLWDDGSDDGSAAVLTRLEQSDTRVRVLGGHGDHRGIASSHAEAIAASAGEYIGWIDSDDLLAPTALAKTVAALDANPSAGMVYTDYFDMDEAGARTRLGQRCKTPYSKDRLLVDFMTFHFRLLRRSVFDAAGGIDLGSQSGAEDYDLCLRMSEQAEIVHVAEPLYFYRSQPTSFSRRQRFDQIQASEEAVRRALARRGLTGQYELTVQISSHFRLRKKVSPSTPVLAEPESYVNIANPAGSPLRVTIGRTRRPTPSSRT
jgi:glycosyltransferase involved in cell wall biosynthesis